MTEQEYEVGVDGGAWRCLCSGCRRLANGASQVTVRNDAQQPITALAVMANLMARDQDQQVVGTGDPLRLYQDTALDADAEPLLPAQSRTFPPFAFYCAATDRSNSEPPRRSLPAGPLCEPEQLAMAAVYADGSTAGNPELLVRLLMRRSNLLLAIDMTIDILRDAGNRNVPRGQLLRQFSLLADSLNRSYVLAEQQTGRRIYQSMLTKLTNLSEGPLGSPFPPSDFVVREVAGLHRQRALLWEALPSVADATLFSDPAHQRLY